MPRIVVIHGNRGVGKTTAAKALAKAWHCPHLDSDQIKRNTGAEDWRTVTKYVLRFLDFTDEPRVVFSCNPKEADIVTFGRRVAPWNATFVYLDCIDSRLAMRVAQRGQTTKKPPVFKAHPEAHVIDTSYLLPDGVVSAILSTLHTPA